MGTGIGHLTSKYRASVLANLPTLVVASCALWASCAIAAPAEGPAGSVADAEVTRFLNEADKALNAGNLNLALIQLKNAVRLAPTNGEVRAHLGAALLRGGDAAAAERELRQAQNDYGPDDIVVPALLRAMLQRNENKELLAEFPDPPQGNLDKTAADILAARAIALQRSGRPKEARAAMDHSLGLRRDADGLVASVRLAQEQGDSALARSQTDETLKLSPTNEAALTSSVLLARQSGDAQKALANADEFVKRVPGSMVAKVLRIEVLLELKQDQRAKQEVDALLMATPKSLYGRYYRGVLMARAKDFKGAWREIQDLQPEFVQSQAPIAKMVAGIAVASGNAESGGAILTTFIARHPDDRLARFQLAALRLGQKAPQAAVDVLAPLKASDDPAVHALLAQAYLALGRFDQAIPSLEIANSSPNANDLLKRQLALVQLQVGENDHAIEGLRDLLQRDPGNAQLAAPLIAALGRTSKWNEALAVADGIAKRAPTSPLPPFYRGQILVARGSLAEGASEFSKALALDPKFVPALYYRANLSAARGNPEEAKKDLQLIINQNPTNMPAYLKLTEIALENSQDQEALSALDHAIKAAPSDPTPRLMLANYQVRQGKYQDAQATVNGLLQVSRNDPEGLALQGQIQFLRGQTTDAINTFRTLANRNASSPGAYALLARALYASKDQPAAEEAAKKAIELAPNSAQMRMELIDIQIGAGKGENALTTARSYANVNPGPDADLLLADALLRLKRTNEAEALLDKSLNAKPDSRVAMRLSQIDMNSGNFKKASAVLTNWITKNPDDFAMRRQYAGLLMGSGDLAGARKEYEALLKQHPDDPIILNNIGWLLQKTDPDRALSLVSLASKIAPRSSDIADTLGWMKYQRQDPQGALPLLQRAHGLDANNAPISYHLALALDATGKRSEAKTLLQATLAKNPKFDGADDAKQLLARW
jgi:cellulose synthase operon protein C